LKILTIFFGLVSFLISSNSVKSFDWESDEQFTVTFEKNLKSGDIKPWKFYHKDSKKHKYIYDIQNAFLKDGHLNVENKKFLDSIVIGQYKKDQLRISFRNSEELNFDYKVIKNRLVFYFKNRKKESSKLAIAKTKPENPKQNFIQYAIDLSKSEKSKKLIILDPGHGGKDGGAVCKKFGVIEKDVALLISKYTAEYLEQMGYRVKLTRDEDIFIELKDRTKFANKNEADLFISIHANSLPKKGNFSAKNGIETYFLSPARSERAKRVALKENMEDLDEVSKIGKNNFLTALNNVKIFQSHKLALDIQSNVIQRLRKYYYNIEDDGVKEAPFWILVGAQMPAVLIEVGYVTGDKDGKRLLARLYKKRLAKGIALGIDNYFKNNK
jgi:N-acetylmuramoyl-L-alanine amidase